MKLFLTPFSYGGMNEHTAESYGSELIHLTLKKIPLTRHPVFGDALISRSRSRAMTEFLKSDCDVMFMFDHDLEWDTGDLLATADMAHLKKSIVGGMYSMRGKNQGCAGRLKGEKVTVHIGRDVLHEAEFVPGGFTAIPRVVVEEVLKACTLAEGTALPSKMIVTECLDYVPFYDFFRCVTVPSELVDGKNEYLSEEWAFGARARFANGSRKQYLWSKPVLVHHGSYGFRMAEAAQPVAPVSLVKP